MATTHIDIAVPAGVWTNLYSAAGIVVGQPVEIFNKGSNNCVIAFSASAPLGTTTGIQLWAGDEETNHLSVPFGEPGIWAYAVQGTTLLVQEAIIGAGMSAKNNAVTSAYSASLIIKASTGTLYGLEGHNSGVAQYIQLHDANALPANGAVPSVIKYVPAASSFEMDFGMYGRAFNNGIVVCCSTTGPTKTIGTNDLWISARYL